MRPVLRTALLGLAVPLLAVTATPTQADPPPSSGNPTFPRCGTAPDDDDRYCIVSVTRNGTAVPEVDYESSGTYFDAQVSLLDDGIIAYSVTEVTVIPMDSPLIDGDIPAGDDWVFVINTGDIRPREVQSSNHVEEFRITGGPVTGYRVRLAMQPSPIAWRQAAGFECTDTGCGDDSTQADLVYDGFINGYVTDRENYGLTAAEKERAVGQYLATNAQYYGLQYVDGGGVRIDLANPHLRSPGTPAQGFFQVRLSYETLIHQFEVPEPRDLRAGNLTVRRGSSSASVPFTISHDGDGLVIEVETVHFSTPRFTIKAKPSRPGKPRAVNVSRPSVRAAKVTFKAPFASGGVAITGYQARCRKGQQRWKVKQGTSSPIEVTGLPKGTVSCQVRASNKVGAGRWSPATSS